MPSASTFNPMVGRGGHGVKPEEGEQYEAGIKCEPHLHGCVATASVFRINKRNNSVSIPVAPWTDQLSEVGSRASELEAKVNIDDNWKLLGAFPAATDVTVVQNSPNPGLISRRLMSFPITRDHVGRLHGDEQPRQKGSASGAGLRHKGRSWADRSQHASRSGSTVFDAAIRYEGKLDSIAPASPT